MSRWFSYKETHGFSTSDILTMFTIGYNGLTINNLGHSYGSWVKNL